MANCSICSSASSCSSCSGSLVSDGSGGCTYPYACPSISSCSTCDNFTGCSACLPGYNITNASFCSVVCGDGTYQATNMSACLPCANYDCSKCLGNGSCTSCNTATNRYLDSTTERCLPLSGHYDDGISTVAPLCEPTCLTCNGGSSANCMSCSVGRVIDAGKCTACAAAAGVGCSECAVSGSNFTCTKCEGSTLSSGSCVFDLPAPSAPSLLPIILGVVGAMLLCCCCLILFCLWRRRRNE